MNKFFRNTKRYIFPLMLSAMAIAASSCGSNPSGDSVGETPSEESPVASSPFPTPSSEIQTPAEITTTPSPTVKTAPLGAETTPTPETPNQNKTGNLKNSDITLYTSDLQCQELVPQKVSVSSNEPVKDAVGKIIAAKNTADINISNYRVNVNSGIATVDFRIPPDSPRQLVSLSSCEQFALFKSIEKTLTSNPKWNIKNVRFTQSGEEIYL
ncbi:sporulation/spore germination protein [Calothrix sp. CCY 0018]|uniref:sporulation/spore germination protein n=1 Tax=Calothrix sp. CCY 0018 TaxID=3103864 RepID=UPI0039C6BFA6